jgi:hypothetical protein
MNHTPSLLELAERCEMRAEQLRADAELLETELSILASQKSDRWAAYENAKNDLTRRNWFVFHDRMSAVKSSAKFTREDEQHYRDCAAALRASNTNKEQEQ